MSEKAGYSGHSFFDQSKLPSYIKILNTKCQIKNVKNGPGWCGSVD